MAEMYAIKWETKADRYSDRVRMSKTGAKLFPREEAIKLAHELNLEYPHIWHEAVLVIADSGTWNNFLTPH